MGALEKLLKPVSEESRAGDDLDEVPEADGIRNTFDVDFKYAVGLAERESDAKPPDWRAALSQIVELTEKSKDIRLAIQYARAGIALGDLDVVDCGLAFIAGLLEGFWDVVHPIGDDGPDLEYRALCFQDIVVPGAFAVPLLGMPFIKDGRTEVTGGQICDSYENGAASQDYPHVKGFLDEWDRESKEELLVRLDSLAASLDKIQSVMSDKCGGGAPNFDDVTKSISNIREGYIELAGLQVEEEVVAAEAVGGSKTQAFSGKIQSRDDVVRALTEIENYYNLAEPGHPVKVALARMRSWVKKDFMEILQDIVPDSVSDAKRVLMETEDSE